MAEGARGIARFFLAECCWRPAAQAQQKSALPAGRLDFAVTYNAAHAGQVSGSQQFWLNDGSARLSGQPYRSLGAVANVTRMHTSNTAAGVPLNIDTTSYEIADLHGDALSVVFPESVGKRS